MTPTRVVVVGAGTAGCVAAGSLAEIEGLQVTLIEAGPDLRGDEDEPGLRGPSHAAALRSAGRTWPDLRATRRVGGEQQPYLRGRGVGGSSAVSGMILSPAEPRDFVSWSQITGCDGWSWEDVHPWFAGTGLAVDDVAPAEVGALGQALLAEASGPATVQLSRDAARRRVTSADSYLEQARRRGRLEVRANLAVDRILVDGRRARGVRAADGTEVPADVVVLCAGAVHSPAVLLRSELDVKGVGAGLRDHPSIRIDLDLHSPAATDRPSMAVTSRFAIGGLSAIGQILAMEYLDDRDPSRGALLGALMTPRSTGTVRLASRNPAIDPIVDLHLLDDPQDVIEMRGVVAEMQRLVATHAFARVASPTGGHRSFEELLDSMGDVVHATGTCAMGTVVDGRGRLFGHDGIVVCDSSVVPVALSVNPALTVTAVAERIAAMLIDDLGGGAASPLSVVT